MGKNQFTENSLDGHDVPSVSGVYLLTDVISNRTYIGSSKNVRTRVVQHFSKMNTKQQYAPYFVFSETFMHHGPSAFTVKILEECSEETLLVREICWLKLLKPTENTMLFCSKGVAFSEDERALRSERTKKLWLNPTYREKSIEARKGNTYSKGYKCTPEQVENRKRAARISNMKRNYGDNWVAEYVRRYPKNSGDVDV